MTPTNPTTSPMDDLAGELASILTVRLDRYEAIPYATTDLNMVRERACDIANLLVDNREAILTALRSPIAHSREEEVERVAKAIYENGPYMVPWDALDPDFEDDRATLDGCRSDARAALASIPPGSDYRRGVEQGLKEAAGIANDYAVRHSHATTIHARKIATEIEGLIGKGER